MSDSKRRQAPLAMDAEAFRRLGHRLVDQIAEMLATMPQGPVTRHEAPADIRRAFGLDGPLPEKGEDADRLLADLPARLAAHSLFNGHPQFYGFITSSPAPIGMLGDMLAAAVNPNVGAWILSPLATEMEIATCRWIAQLIGYPATSSGVLVSGGNMANMVCFFAARASRAWWNVREEGLTERQRLRMYASAETHTWIQKAADLSGVGTSSIRWIPVDDRSRMDLKALEKAIDRDQHAGDIPFLVVGTGGSVSTGAVDPLREIGALCKKKEVWFHVDGAYGGFAAAVPEASDDLRALSEADSVAVDPHKWLYAPMEAGCALVRKPEHHKAAFAFQAPYYHFGEETVNLVNYGPQNSRGFRALKVWLGLRQAGAEGYRRMISDDIRLSRCMAEAVKAHPEMELWTQDLSIATFRFVPSDLKGDLGREEIETYLDTLNKTLLEKSQAAGEVFVSNAIVRKRFLLRACIVNFRTDEADVIAVPEIFARLGRELDRELRPAELSSAR